MNAREVFYDLAPKLLAEDPRLALVLAEIGVGAIGAEAARPVAQRVFNVGIREQLMIGVAGGLALAGMRPVVHSFAPFLIERPFEQVKLDLGHQGVGAVLVSAGASYGWPGGGETHFGHRDVALLDTLDGWSVHVPGHAAEVEPLLRGALPGDGRAYLRLDVNGNAASYPEGLLRRGNRGTVIAVGPVADRVLAAAADLDVTVIYVNTVRPFDADLLQATLSEPEVAIVEPYLEGTSVGAVTRALAGVRSRVMGVGVQVEESRRYGTVAEHHALNGLDVEGLRVRLADFFYQQLPS